MTDIKLILEQELNNVYKDLEELKNNTKSNNYKKHLKRQILRNHKDFLNYLIDLIK